MSAMGRIALHLQLHRGLADRTLAQSLESSIAELPHSFAGDAEHFADLVECVLTIGIERVTLPEVNTRFVFERMRVSH